MFGSIASGGRDVRGEVGRSLVLKWREDSEDCVGTMRSLIDYGYPGSILVSNLRYVFKNEAANNMESMRGASAEVDISTTRYHAMVPLLRCLSI